MKDIGIVVLVIAGALAFVGLAVFAVPDKSVLVPPPDTAAESFVRELGMARYELARHYLARELQQQTSGEELRANFEPLRQRTGKPDQVETQTALASGDRARVLATLEGRRSTATMYVDLVREQGMWKVAAWPLEVVGR